MEKNISQYLKKLNQLNDNGYFVGLNPDKFFNVLLYNYNSANEDEKKIMDNNSDLLLERYKSGVVQTNLIYKELISIKKIFKFFLIITIISIVGTLIFALELM